MERNAGVVQEKDGGVMMRGTVTWVQCDEFRINDDDGYTYFGAIYLNLRVGDKVEYNGRWIRL